MAETVTIGGQSYLKRNPLGVLGLTVITLGIYFLYWFWKINDELRLYKRDESISPTRSLMAMLFGWLIIVPPFIAMYNTSKHVQDAEQRLGVQPQLEPALTIVFLLIVAIGNTIYVQEHLNRIWDRASVSKDLPTPGASGLPMPPAP
jgi:mannose/fructose/N-acetylgalactosamine-specific phosphotransferase system component IIC